MTRAATAAICLMLLLLTGATLKAQIPKQARHKAQQGQLIAPSFPGGDSVLQHYLRNRIRYPAAASENGIEGTVILDFLVNEKGLPEDIRISRDIGAGCGAEAVRVVKQLPAWNPGTCRGRKVKMWYELPVRFYQR